ncbi:diacylglycerol kinase epsilon isoform X1 [Schistocerca piceifrons]|uniref:diacylglycerol kinase epsilon isoform X1 n=1 Tax=Schistocerca piceifrons TaxID=274613 RepID=UPI001F5ED55C|nr:diacylglycerol kinase epsilon isoform X1 [Schistocerca piceifrons]XP_047108670.1 diacylglycerol kinase epsilon isoform X1 [Schistocerca piceifrons]XP_047108671.1 diacylglycerol kinase epsilon isoform X1 [Schistocerca piceifrons]XP_047108672.1 diacylglycerol kinase epsilon isoform X1 [Schistocerca piceifrons]XP_047108673.1 diacylglycerol kinase epsilon isoform X1 [Schistocerca piceifrons]
MWQILMLWNAELTSVIWPFILALLMFLVTVAYFKYLNRDTHVQIHDASKKHYWSFNHPLTKSGYCSICESLLLTNRTAVCDSCGVCANVECVNQANRKLKCKAISLKEKGPIKHHWVKGNLPAGAVCDVCDDECGCGPGLVDWQCCWCQRAVHTACKPQLGQMCDYGRFKNLVIPPTSVVLTTRQHKLSRKLCLQSVTKPEWNDWTPLIVLANQKSGNKDGGMVLALFRHLLNPAQVIDLTEHSPEAALEWCCFLNEKGISTRLLVAGGDGTIGWVLNAVEKKNLICAPALAIVPLGTGNDLSRVLGWGKEQPSPLDPSAVLDEVQKAEIANLDRWKVEIKPVRHLGIRLPIRRIFMYNYLSIGVDAQIALDFHRTRESPYYLFASRIFNKMLYLGFGTQQAVGRDCHDLNKRVELYLDGVKADLPSIESIVVMNIPSWGAGVQLWTMGTADETVPSQNISDGKLEVVGIYSSFHIAQLQVGLSQPYRFGQASQVKITLKSPAPIQVDGEPWLQKTSEINIHFHNQATVLKLKETVD